MLPHYTWKNSDLYLEIGLQTRAKKNAILEASNAKLKIAITSPPIDNKANDHLIKFLAHYFKVPQRKVKILRGVHNKNKLLRIENPKSNFEQFKGKQI
jgi:uncharacterized protein